MAHLPIPLGMIPAIRDSDILKDALNDSLPVGLSRRWKGIFFSWQFVQYPLVNIQKATDNDHRDSEFSHYINMVIFHGYVSLPEGNMTDDCPLW
jgi:hypothetical protein